MLELDSGHFEEANQTHGPRAWRDSIQRAYYHLVDTVLPWSLAIVCLLAILLFGLFLYCSGMGGTEANAQTAFLSASATAQERSPRLKFLQIQMNLANGELHEIPLWGGNLPDLSDWTGLETSYLAGQRAESVRRLFDSSSTKRQLQVLYELNLVMDAWDRLSGREQQIVTNHSPQLASLASDQSLRKVLLGIGE